MSKLLKLTESLIPHCVRNITGLHPVRAGCKPGFLCLLLWETRVLARSLALLCVFTFHQGRLNSEEGSLPPTSLQTNCL